MPCDRKRAAAAVAAALDLIAVCVERYRDDVFSVISTADSSMLLTPMPASFV